MGARTDLAAEFDQRPATIPYSIFLQLTVRDPQTIEALDSYAEGEPRDEFALTALQIGVAALRQARGRVDADAVRRESERMLADLKTQLQAHATDVNRTLTEMLKQYFDPQSGRFEERVKRLVAKDGELEVLLRKHIGQDSEMGKTLSGFVGVSSPLMKMLDPDQSKGLLAILRQSVDEQLKQQRDDVLGQFSLDNEESALSRLVRELTNRQGELSQNFKTKIDEVVKEFSLDQEDSALSRLVRNVDRAQRTITSEFSLDHEHSALARLKRELVGLLKEQHENNRKFQEQVTGALQAMSARKQEADKSTRHGLDFEDALFEFVQVAAHQAGDVATHTGHTTGLIKSCKVGDCIVELGPDSAAAGARIVLEAKENASYQLAKAREEMHTARKNRGGQIGVFVFSAKTAPAGLESLARFGDDICVVWDAEDSSTDVYLKAALTLAKALCVRTGQARAAAEHLDFAAMDAAILDIEKRAGMLDDIHKSAQAIGNHADKIVSRVTSTRRAMEKQLKVLQEATLTTRETVAELLQGE